jgi:hypothetical protein
METADMHAHCKQCGQARCFKKDFFEALSCALQDTIKAHREAASPTPPTEANRLDPEQAQALGWYPHGKPFRWPAPRDPDTYNTHPLKPSGHRVEELQEAWQEGGLAGAAAAATTSSRDPGATNGTG